MPSSPMSAHDRSILRQGEGEEGDGVTTGGQAQERAEGDAGNMLVLWNEAL